MTLVMTTPPAADAVREIARHVYPVILCGGSGTRLWPLSRETYPKQLLSLTSDRSLLQDTAIRACQGLGLRAPVVLCGDEQRFLVSEQLEQAGVVPTSILCEPTGRNTAPALAMAALYLLEHDPDAILLALPSDHFIGDVNGFRDVLNRALIPAERGYLVCFGMAPTRPETGYGYIQTGEPLDNTDGVCRIARFIEKPDIATAEGLLADGNYLWNSGMFLMSAAGYLEELDRHAPDVAAACTTARGKSRSDGLYLHFPMEEFTAAPSISIDYAVMERTGRAAVIPAAIGWNDIGSWRSLRDVGTEDEDGNVIIGDVITEETRNSYIRSDHRLVATIGIENMIIVETDDAILIGNADRAPEVGTMARKLKQAGRSEATTHRRVYRPWGYYESLDCGSRHQVKHIMVKPGAQLSLQMHHHRSEHWIVVAGIGRIVCDSETKLLRENEWSYIPLGSTHRLENPGKLPLHLIEVQIGSYLGEDDIVRFDDSYGRV